MTAAGSEDASAGPSALRRCLSRPASLGDLLEAWMLTHPSNDKRRPSADEQQQRQATRRALRKAGNDDSAIDFWMSGD